MVHAFRGQWNVEELFRRAKKGGVVPWGPSHQCCYVRPADLKPSEPEHVA